MKRSIAVLMVAMMALGSILAVPGALAADYDWGFEGTIFAERTSFASAELPDGRIFVACGYDPNLTSRMNETWVLDPEDMSWEQLPDAPMRLESPTGAYASGSVHLFGGITPSWTYPEYVLEYDISAGEWSTGTEMPYPGMFIRCAAIDDHRIMIAGGENNSVYATDSCFIFDALTGDFTEAEPLPEGRSGGSMVHMDGRVYYMGGWSNTSVVQDDIFAYDVAADNWSLAGNLPQALSGIASVASSNGLVYMIGGGTSSGWYSATVDKALAWDPVDGRFMDLPGLEWPLKYAAAFELDGGRMFYLGGHNLDSGHSNMYSLPMFDITAQLDQDTAAQGESAWVQVQMESEALMDAKVSGEMYLWKDNVTWGMWSFGSVAGSEVMLELTVPEDLPAGEYMLVFDNVRMNEQDWKISSLELIVTDAPSVQEKLDDLQDQNDALQGDLETLEEQNQDLMDEIETLKEADEGKLDAMIGYAILIVAIIALVVGIIVLVRKK